MERAESCCILLLSWSSWLQVSEFGTVDVKALMEIERYSHVMHISSTVTGRLKAGLDAWDALRAALPAGTVSGAPKVQLEDFLHIQNMWSCATGNTFIL